MSGGGSLAIYRLEEPAGRAAIERLVARGAVVLNPGVVEVANRLVEHVRSEGDVALLDAVRRYDRSEVSAPTDLRLTVPSAETASEGLPEGFADAIGAAIESVEAFHRPQVHPGYRMERDGMELEEFRRPLARVGVYVPGGLATYPSTVVMSVVPAQLAGVKDIAVATPPRSFMNSPALRYTLARLGVSEVWGMGGAHAVAALAYGTETVRRVDKIVGPGNAWVTAAKRAVLGDVAIDGLAGPSEVVVVATSEEDGNAKRPAWIAADLLAQAEHDPKAAAVLLTPDAALAEAVVVQVDRQLTTLPTAATARASLATFGGAFVVPDLEAALACAERLAPEHLQLIGGAEALAPRVRCAGAVFVGAATPEVFGDYVAGPSHVLPTCGSARFASALGVEDFVRRSHQVRFSTEAAGRWARVAAALADVEGLPAHAAAARLRSNARADGGAR